MNPEQRQLIRRLSIAPGRPATLDGAGLREALGLEDLGAWALGELRAAVSKQSADDLDYAISAGSALDVIGDWVVPLSELLFEDWHYDHGPIAHKLGHIRDPRSLGALMHAAYWVPEYLEWDESRDLAVKAIHAIGLIPGPEADAALQELLLHEDHALRRRVQRVIDRR